MSYQIKYYNKFNEPYYYENDSEICIHENSEMWEVQSKEKALQIIKDFLNVPEGELSLDQIRKDFTDANKLNDESKLVSIQNYYNGRLALWKHIQKELNDISNDSAELKYQIPEKYNSFSIEDNDEISQIDSYIQLKII